MRCYAQIAIYLILALAWPQGTGAREGFSHGSEEPPALARDAWRATVLVQKEFLDRSRVGEPTFQYPGSGVILRELKDGYLLIATSLHVTSCGYLSCRLRVGFEVDSARPFPVWAREAKVLVAVPAKDLALLRVLPPQDAEFEVAVLGDSEELTRGVEILTTGFPVLRARARWAADPPDDYPRLRRRWSSGHLLRAHPSYPLYVGEDRQRRPVDVLIHDADLLPGNSGGPLVGPRGEILGLNTAIGRFGWVDGFSYCAGQSKDDQPCLHLAVSSDEILVAFGEILERDDELSPTTGPER